MPLISLIISILLSTTPASSFICGDHILNAKIYNNQNGDFTIIKDIKKIDLGSFVVLDWIENLMLPRTFIKDEVSFSDNKWKWIYKENNEVKLIERKPSGAIINYECKENKTI